MIRTMSLAVLLLATAQTHAQEVSRADARAVNKQLALLGQENTSQEKIEALRWFDCNPQNKETARAVPALAQVLKSDPDHKVRMEAVRVAAMILRKEQRPCPASLFAAFGDAVDEVRWQAVVYIGMLKTFEPECVPILIEYSKAKNPHVRSNAYTFLALAAPKDEKVRQLLRDAAASEKDDSASHDAHCSLHNATKKIEDLLPYFIGLWADVDEPQPPRSAQTVEQNERIARKNLFRLSTSYRMAEWAEDRPEELTRLLLEQSKSDKTATRRGLLHLLKGSASSIARGKFAQRPDPWDMDAGPSWTYFLLPYIEQDGLYTNIFGKK
ncbi:MAG: HEAT repeat domain-containing protein, partial [Gemmataceae bacterium]|nr:HEAT repeat domain-containing protein [Gemmataceae bacterium]